MEADGAAPGSRRAGRAVSPELPRRLLAAAAALITVSRDRPVSRAKRKLEAA